MKTQRLSKQNTQPYKTNHASPEDKKEERMTAKEEKDKMHEFAQILREQQKQRIDKDIAEGQKAIREMLDRNIEWRELKFHHHAKDGYDFVDIIDRDTGEVLKTIPEPDYAKLANHFKQHPGITLDISG